MRKKKSVVNFAKKTHNIYAHQQKRAREHGQILDYDLAQLRKKITQAFLTGCPYCGRTLTLENFQCDHGESVGQGGSFALWNVIICCRPCNEAKGQLSNNWFVALLRLLEQMPASHQQDILRRLRAGGRFR